MKSNKIYRIILFSALFFIFSSVWAQEDVFRYPLTQRTINDFNAACAKVAEKPVVKGNFSQEKRLSRFNRSLNSTGNFIIARDHGMVWETLQPFPSTMIMGNNFILQSRPDGQKSVISAQGNETFVQMASIISSVFSGNSRGLLENFEVFFSGNVSSWEIGLLPKNRMISSFASKIIMSGDVTSDGNAAIRSIRIFEQNDDIITYTMINHNYPAELNENEKAFFSIP